MTAAGTSSRSAGNVAGRLQTIGIGVIPNIW